MSVLKTSPANNENKNYSTSSKLKSTVGDNTNKKFDVPNDLRHESKTNDLQATCCSLEVAKSEMEKLRAENETLKNELKDLQAKMGEVSADQRRMMEPEIESLKSVRDELQMMHVASSNASVQDEDVSRKGSGDYSEGSVGAPKGCRNREQLDYYVSASFDKFESLHQSFTCSVVSKRRLKSSGKSAWVLINRSVNSRQDLVDLLIQSDEIIF